MHCDRYFISVPLAQELQKQDTSYTGTVIHSCIDFPELVCCRSMMQQGEVRVYRREQLLVIAWM